MYRLCGWEVMLRQRGHLVCWLRDLPGSRRAYCLRNVAQQPSPKETLHCFVY